MVSAVQTPARPAVPVTLIKAGRLLDPRHRRYPDARRRAVEDTTIKEVRTPSPVDPPAGRSKILNQGSAGVAARSN